MQFNTNSTLDMSAQMFIRNANLFLNSILESPYITAYRPCTESSNALVDIMAAKKTIFIRDGVPNLEIETKLYLDFLLVTSAVPSLSFLKTNNQMPNDKLVIMPSTIILLIFDAWAKPFNAKYFREFPLKGHTYYIGSVYATFDLFIFCEPLDDFDDGMKYSITQRLQSR